MNGLVASDDPGDRQVQFPRPAAQLKYTVAIAGHLEMPRAVFDLVALVEEHVVPVARRELA